MTILMEYLAVTDVGSTRFGSHKKKLLKWADNEMANTVKIYKMTGKCPLVGFYMRRMGAVIRASLRGTCSYWTSRRVPAPRA